MQKWNRSLYFSFMLLMTFVFLIPASTVTITLGAPLDEALSQGEVTTPYQSALMQALDVRRAAGLPVPTSVALDVDTALDPGADRSESDDTVTVTATTTVYFSGPEQAGYDTWPRLIVGGSVPEGAQGTITAGDYTDHYRAEMERRFPGIWSRYQFGKEPRRHTVTETITYSPGDMLAEAVGTRADVSDTEAILMGFSLDGPRFNYFVEDSEEVCFIFCVTIYSFKAGFELDWDIGLRLPAQVTLTGPSLLLPAAPAAFVSRLNPLDWSAADFSSAGVSAYNGSEYAAVLRFFVGVQGELLGIDLCPWCYAEVDVNESRSFTTPFGPGASFPLGTVNVPVKEWDLLVFSFGAGVSLRPNLAGSTINADWDVTPGSACTGGGQVTFTQPGAPVTLSPVTCSDVTSQATIALRNFRFAFTQSRIDILAFLSFELFGYGLWNPSFQVLSLNVTDLFPGLGANMGAHTQCRLNPFLECGRTGPDDVVDLWVAVQQPVGRLQVEKVVDWSGAEPTGQAFEVCITGPSYPNAPNCQSFYEGSPAAWDDLTVGTYTITETNPGADWTIVSGSPQTVQVVAEQTAFASISNRYIPPFGGLTVSKAVDWGGVTPFAATFEVCITGPSHPTPSCQPVSEGSPASWANLTPGDYAITESDPGADWTILYGSPETVIVASNQTAEVVIGNQYTPVCPIFSAFPVTRVWWPDGDNQDVIRLIAGEPVTYRVEGFFTNPNGPAYPLDGLTGTLNPGEELVLTYPPISMWGDPNPHGAYEAHVKVHFEGACGYIGTDWDRFYHDTDQDGAPNDVDCNVNDPTIYPGAPEVPGDGVDQDCDGADQPAP